MQVTTIQADAADEAAISGVCKQALQEEGKLDEAVLRQCKVYSSFYVVVRLIAG
jgi:hypothetical protein